MASLLNSDCRFAGSGPALSGRLAAAMAWALAVTAAAPQDARVAFDHKSLPLFTEGKPYLGKWETGLYPGGRNEIPPEHLRAGLRIAQMIRPLNARGNVDQKDGRIVGLVKGHSNTTLYFTAFQRHLQARADELNERFTLVVGSVGGQQLPELVRLEGPVWDKSQRSIAQAGCTKEQVQVLFLHTTFHGAGRRDGVGPPPPPFPESMQKMHRDLAVVLGHCVRIYPNLRIAYLTTDGLRAFTGLEPHVWREAFGVKWLIESQIKGQPGTDFQDKDGEPRKLPWLCWGPYIWDNAWDRGHFTDGVHPTPRTCSIFVEKYWKHLESDPIARPWLFRPRTIGASTQPATRRAPG